MQGMFVFPANSYAEALSPRVFGIWKWGLWEVITFRYGHEGVSLIIGFNRINVLIRKGRERERERDNLHACRNKRSCEHMFRWWWLPATQKQDPHQELNLLAS